MSLLQTILIILILFLLALFSTKITRQYTRAVVFRFGRLAGIKGPGIFLIIPFVDQIVRVDLRIRQLDVPKQTIITRDNISVDVDAVIYYHVKDASSAIVEVEDYE
ncbi:MAG: slipin family protein, partial [Deltaproteobacteria bacterium]|nr:slipin family protein [Deltaproteobacteria bacterium]